MPFLPNLNATLRRAKTGTDEYDAYGNRSYQAAEPIRLAVVRLDAGVSKTSVRADSSASRGAAEELLHDARLLFPTRHLPKTYDLIEIAGVVLETKSVMPRFDVFGRLDHYQVDADRFAGDL